jgi:hypothetical protein
VADQPTPKLADRITLRCTAPSCCAYIEIYSERGDATLRAVARGWDATERHTLCPRHRVGEASGA